MNDNLLALGSYAVIVALFCLPYAIRGAWGEWREWLESRPGTDLLPVVPTLMREERDEFITGSIEVVPYEAPLPLPADSEALLTLTAEAATS